MFDTPDLLPRICVSIISVIKSKEEQKNWWTFHQLCRIFCVRLLVDNAYNDLNAIIIGSPYKVAWLVLLMA